MCARSRKIGEVTLKPWQVNNSRRLTSICIAHKRALDASDTGTGKTITALAVAYNLGANVLIICPKAVIPSWHVWAHKMGLRVVVTNYEAIRAGKSPFYQKRKVGGKMQYWSTLPENSIVIFDEAHRCKGYNTLTSRMLKEFVDMDFKILLLSATPYQNPTELRSIGYALGLHNFYNFRQWMLNHDCSQDHWGAWKYKGDRNALKQINERVSARCVRTRWDDIEGFPETLIQPELIDFGEEFVTAQKEFHYELTILAQSRRMDTAVVRFLQHRQETEILKAKTIAAIVNDLVAQNIKVVTFWNYTRSIEVFLENIKHNVCVVTGDRKDDTKAFQDGATMIAACQFAAGGAGISLHGEASRIAILNPPVSAVDLKQALGRIHRFGGGKTVQKILFAADTIETKVYKRVADKVKDISTLTDGDLALDHEQEAWWDNVVSHFGNDEETKTNIKQKIGNAITSQIRTLELEAEEIESVHTNDG